MSEPLILGIETSGLWTGTALVRGEAILFEQSLGPGTDHNEKIVMLIEQALAKAPGGLHALEGVGVAIGPGMFTSLRVGLAAAKAVCLVRNCPLRGINTLAALAASVAESGSAPVLTVVDARKNQLYAALWQQDGCCLLAPAAVDTAAIAEWLATTLPTGATLVITGNGRELCRQRLEDKGYRCIGVALDHPRPAAIARLAGNDIATGTVDDLESLTPCYLRQTDAELTRARQNPEQPRN